MTLKQQLEEQLQFAKGKMKALEGSSYIGSKNQLHTWSGYVQGLRYAIGLTGSSGVAETQVVKKCQCDQNDLQPFGECICGASKVSPI